MKIKTIFIHFFAIIMLVIIVYSPIKLSYIQDQKLFKVIHMTEDTISQIQDNNTSILDKLYILCLAIQGDSNIITINRQLLSETSEQSVHDKIASILLESLNKLCQSNIISELDFEKEPFITEATLSSFTNQSDSKSVHFYSIHANCFPYIVFAIIDVNTSLIYSLDICSVYKNKPIFEDKFNHIEAWQKYLGISLNHYTSNSNSIIYEFPYNTNNLIKYQPNISISYTYDKEVEHTENKKKYYIVSTKGLTNCYEIGNTSMFYLFSYPNAQRELSIQLGCGKISN